MPPNSPICPLARSFAAPRPRSSAWSIVANACARVAPTRLSESSKAPDWISAWIGPLVARDQRNWRLALDAVAPDRPVLLRGFWGHTAIVNSAALQRIGITEDVADPIGGQWGRDANGRLNGRADEGASPCGACRQVLNEFGPDMTVTVESGTGERAVWRLTEILPHAFGPSNLGK